MAFAPAEAAEPDVRYAQLVWYLVQLDDAGVRCEVGDGVCYATRSGAGGASRAFAAEVVDRVHNLLGTRMVAGVGATRAEADAVVAELRRRRDVGPVADIAAVRPYAAVAAAGEVVATSPHLRLPHLAVLREHDRRHGTAYVPTLRAYLDTFGDVPASAHRLGVHINTFRYRLRRLAGLTGLDLADPDQRLLCHLELAAAP